MQQLRVTIETIVAGKETGTKHRKSEHRNNGNRTSLQNNTTQHKTGFVTEPPPPQPRRSGSDEAEDYHGEAGGTGDHKDGTKRPKVHEHSWQSADFPSDKHQDQTSINIVTT